MEGRGYPRHLVLPEEPLAEIGGHCHAGGGPWGAAMATSQPICQLESQYRSRGRDVPHDEALREAREAHQQVLEAAHMLELNIERLSQEVENVQHDAPTAAATAACSVGLWIGIRGLQASTDQRDMWSLVTLKWSWFWAKGPTEDLEGLLPEHNLREAVGAPCPSDGQKWYIPWWSPWPTHTLEIEWVICQNHQLGTTKCGWIGEPAS